MLGALNPHTSHAEDLLKRDCSIRRGGLLLPLASSVVKRISRHACWPLSMNRPVLSRESSVWHSARCTFSSAMVQQAAVARIFVLLCFCMSRCVTRLTGPSFATGHPTTPGFHPNESSESPLIRIELETESRMSQRALTIILAGGKGTRLEPLTTDRAKPAVPFAGEYRIIDFPLSNCVNSGLFQVLVLTQYKSLSLDRHLDRAWKPLFQRELGAYLDIVPPQQRVTDEWYRGTADAVYQNIYSIKQARPENVVILAGDHIYTMDYREMLHFHEESRADVTIGAYRVPVAEAARQFGVIQVDGRQRVTGFQEKPELSIPRRFPATLDTRWPRWASMSSAPSSCWRRWAKMPASRASGTTLATTFCRRSIENRASSRFHFGLPTERCHIGKMSAHSMPISTPRRISCRATHR